MERKKPSSDDQLFWARFMCICKPIGILYGNVLTDTIILWRLEPWPLPLFDVPVNDNHG